MVWLWPRGDDYGVAGFEVKCGLRLVDDLRPRVAVHHDVKSHDVLELGHDLRADAGRARRRRDPRRARVDVEVDGAGQSHLA